MAPLRSLQAGRGCCQGVKVGAPSLPLPAFGVSPMDRLAFLVRDQVAKRGSLLLHDTSRQHRFARVRLDFGSLFLREISLPERLTRV
jgi:hypothetical protein